MKILAIETSCDDTCIAITETDRKRSGFKILGNVVSSQIKIHQKWGGVYPTLAKREHQKNLVPVLIKVLRQAKLLKKSKLPKKPDPQTLKQILSREQILYTRLTKFLETYEKPDIDLIAVTIGPGLEPSLWVGINFARVLAFSWNLAIKPINHIEAHILINWLKPTKKDYELRTGTDKLPLPALCLIVSGGHTQLVLMKDFGDYRILGETRDDAAGECFDKTAKLLGLSYPGGPAISLQAEKASTKTPRVFLPRPMIKSPDFDFSFSGLKTAVLYKVKPKKYISTKFVRMMAKEIQQAIIDVLIKKTFAVTKKFKVKSIILGGGVTANKELRQQMAEKIKTNLPDAKYFVPQLDHSTDNALMVAVAAVFTKTKATKRWQTLEAKANLQL
ncbi:MAG: tRNA (adenosine(37)-N6)-threonylcarbamoyltransferase complex transferase subunit TsaD [bacterium]